MTSPFQRKIRTALQNEPLQEALDNNAERRRLARSSGYASLVEDLSSLRRRTHAVRQETIENLEIYLEQFSAKAQANGLVVHRAATAAEAVAIVLDLARQAGVRRVVKSKTMVGEEIELNPALEAAGLRVVETDLGEWIVQLRGERPAHLITPAVHLRRSDVAKLFQEKFNLDYTEDVTELTAFARRTLRQEFLSADLGITGVNFGVAETGGLCLLTNEGNGRLAATLPRLHIALMGIERLVPTLDDLALMLSLLPRSATGQKLTVYTTLIHSPRRTGEADGALERHVILLDNGRRELRRSPLVEALYCIRCGACLNACPVFRELGGHAYVGAHGQPTAYSGPIGSVLSPGLFGLGEFGNLARASSLCGACQEACPVDIPLPQLLLRVRAGLGAEKRENEEKGKEEGGNEQKGKGKRATAVPHSLNVALRMFAWLAVSPRRFRAAQKLGGLAGGWLAPRTPWLRLPAFTGWGLSRKLPRPDSKPFSARWEGINQATKRAGEAPGGLSASGDIFASTGPERPPGKVGTPAWLPDTPVNSTQPAGLAPKTMEGRLEQFKQGLEAVSGEFVECERGQLNQKLVEIFEAMGSRQVLAWGEAALPEGTLAALRAAGFSFTHTPDPNINIGLSGALAAAADCAALVIASGRGCPQTASLLTETHVAILEAERILADLPQVFNLPEVKEAAMLSLVAGPSRTADIEMTLTIGVHGPRRVIVVCIV